MDGSVSILIVRLVEDGVAPVIFFFFIFVFFVEVVLFDVIVLSSVSKRQ